MQLIIIIHTFTVMPKKKAKKKRSAKYDPKLKVNGSFINLIDAIVKPKK